MARFESCGIDDLVKDLSGLDVDRIAPLMLEEAVPTLEKNVKKRTALHRDTGALQKSIKPTKPKKGRNGYSVVVRPTGIDEKGVRNAEKVVYLEYGTSKQRATPVLSPAVRESEEEICSKMQEVFNREAGK